MSKRKAEKTAYEILPNGKDIHVPSISATHYFRYFALGVQLKTLGNFKKAVDGNFKIEMWDMLQGVLITKYVLNYETARWDLLN